MDHFQLPSRILDVCLPPKFDPTYLSTFLPFCKKNTLLTELRFFTVQASKASGTALVSTCTFYVVIAGLMVSGESTLCCSEKVGTVVAEVVIILTRIE